MNILYCGDANILDGMLLSVISLTHHVAEPLHVYCLTAELKTDQKHYRPLDESFVLFLDHLLKEHHTESHAERIDITELFESKLPLANIKTRFTPCCMLRLFADCVEELPNRLLYLDNDVICRGDPADFYHQDMDGCELAGVLDYYGSWFFRHPRWRIWRRDYLNSGVLLLDLVQIRRTGLFEKSREMCAEREMFMPDQSALNRLAEKKKLCPRRYNEQRIIKDDTVFRHFTTTFRFFPRIKTVTVKPWDTERLHGVLKIFEFDGLIEEAETIKQNYKMTLHEGKENPYEYTT